MSAHPLILFLLSTGSTVRPIGYAMVLLITVVRLFLRSSLLFCLIFARLSHKIEQFSINL